MEKSPQKLYEEANKHYYEHGDIETAIALHKKIIFEFPNSSQAGYSENQLQIMERALQPDINQAIQSKSEYGSDVIVTTAPSVNGYFVEQTLEVITAECVFGMNVFRDMFAGITDFFGGRSEATQKILRDARKTCLSELKREAKFIGANAVIAARLDYSEFSGKGKSMLFLVASGTAVVIKNKKADEQKTNSD